MRIEERKCEFVLDGVGNSRTSVSGIDDAEVVSIEWKESRENGWGRGEACRTISSHSEKIRLIDALSNHIYSTSQ